MEIQNGCVRKITDGLNRVKLFDIIIIVSVSVQFKERERERERERENNY